MTFFSRQAFLALNFSTLRFACRFNLREGICLHLAVWANRYNVTKPLGLSIANRLVIFGVLNLLLSIIKGLLKVLRKFLTLFIGQALVFLNFTRLDGRLILQFFDGIRFNLWSYQQISNRFFS